MAYHDDLIKHAIFLSELNRPHEPKQVDLRGFGSILQSFPYAYDRGRPELETSESAGSICQNVRSWPHEDMLFEGFITPASCRSRRKLHCQGSETRCGSICQTSAGSAHCRL